MHSVSRFRMIMGYADMVMWHACTAMVIWHADMRIVLLSTHPTEIDQARPKNQSGTGTDQLLDYPQHRKPACRRYENGDHKTCAHLCVRHCDRLTRAPGCCENVAGTCGDTQCENTAQMPGARGGCSWAGRACGVGQMCSDSHAGLVGGKHEAV